MSPGRYDAEQTVAAFAETEGHDGLVSLPMTWPSLFREPWNPSRVSVWISDPGELTSLLP